MKFKKRSSPKQELTDRERRLRAHLWNDPGIVERLFSDSEWKSYSNDNSQSAIPTERMSANLQQAIATDSQNKIQMLRRMRQRQQVVRYAIAAAVILFCGIFSWRVWLGSSPDIQTANHVAEVMQPSDTSSTFLENTSKESQHFTLPDGSSVTLYAQAKLSYPTAFSPSSRELHLEGKAYFDVAKDAARPFSVYAGATKTTALGTSFTINTQEKNQRTSIILHSGKVAVAPISTQADLKRTILSERGERILFNDAFELVAHHTPNLQKRSKEVQIDGDKIVAKGLLAMDNIPLSQVMTHLGDAYGKTIHFGEHSLQQIQYTGTVDLSKEKLEDVLAIICLINDLHYVVQEDGSYVLLRQMENDNTTMTNQHDTTKQ